jgi:hypothetical protein
VGGSHIGMALLFFTFKNINRLAFVMVTECVLYEVGTWFLNMACYLQVLRASKGIACFMNFLL